MRADDDSPGGRYLAPYLTRCDGQGCPRSATCKRQVGYLLDLAAGFTTVNRLATSLRDQCISFPESHFGSSQYLPVRKSDGG